MIIPILINQFNGGMTEDKRQGWSATKTEATTNKYSITKHFDAFTYPHKLVPYAKRETTPGLSGGVISDMKLTRFLYAQNQTTLYRLYGLGDDGSGHLKVFKLDIEGATDLDTATWSVPSNATSATGARSEKVFDYYKGYLYMYQGTTGIARFDTTEATGFADSWQTIDDATIGVRPVRHPNDDIMYFFGAKNVYALDNTSWKGSVLAFSSDLQIKAVCPFGNYLAIGCTTKGNLARQSIIFLWDRDSSLTTLTERIDLGEGTLLHLANLNNRLFAVISYYPTSAFAIAKAKILVKTPSSSGTFASTVSEVIIDTAQTDGDFPSDNMVRDNKLYFAMKATLNGDTRVGIWGVDQTGRLTLDQREPALDVNPHTSAIRGIYATANLWWIAYDDGAGGAGSYSVTRTDDDGLYDTTNPSIYESLIFNAGDTTLNKKLIGVSVMTEPLPSGASVVIKYRKDSETAWTTIATGSTQNSLSHSAVKIETTGANLPELSEIQFRLESLGGAVITGFKAKVDTLDKGLY